jgi:hypothetical protein
MRASTPGGRGDEPCRKYRAGMLREFEGGEAENNPGDGNDAKGAYYV